MSGEGGGGPGPDGRTPHPATVVQTKRPFGGVPERTAHPARVARGEARPPHPATVVQPKVRPPVQVVGGEERPPPPTTGTKLPGAPRPWPKQRVAQRMQQNTVLNAQDLADAVLREFNQWGNNGFYPTGATGQTRDGSTDQTITTTKENFLSAFETCKKALEKQGYYIRHALSFGAKFKATDIIVSKDPGFSKDQPKMVFHIWGEYS